MTREENLHWIDEEIRTWGNECQSKHPIKEALYAARKALEQEPCKDAVSVTSVFEIMGNLLSIPYDFDRIITEKDVSESMDKIRALPRVTPQEPQTFKWCTNCKEYDQEKHCCHRWSNVIRDTVEEMKQKYIEREVLDKIRAEIEEVYINITYQENRKATWGLRKAMQIIDKYKSESEG